MHCLAVSGLCSETVSFKPITLSLIHILVGYQADENVVNLDVIVYYSPLYL